MRFEWIILTDIDGTLDYKCKGIGEKVIKSARNFVLAGGGLGFATGRAIVSTKDLARVMKINIPSILYGGAMLYDFEKKYVLWTCPIQKDIIGLVKDIIRDYPDVCMMVYTDTGIFILNSNDMIWSKGIPQECDPINQNSLITGNILKLNMCGDRERLEQIRRAFKSTELNFSYSSSHFAEVVSQESGKRKAMQVLSDILKIPLERFIAMGDGHNDLDMLAHAGIAYTLENAEDSLKKVSDWVLPHCKKQGAAEGFMLAAQMIKSHE